MNTAYLLTGGNLGNRRANLKHAKNLLQKYCGEILNASSVYETEAWGITDQPLFYNQALKIKTDLQPNDLMKNILLIEKEMGRERFEKLGPRIIDIDILLIDEEIINEPDLKVPHPFLPQRKFALMPLAEIAGDIIHPSEKKTIHQLLYECPDKLNVHKISSIPSQ